jgi:hypothetical protein
MEIGTKIKFNRVNGTVAEDTIRGFCTVVIMLEPYARNQSIQAAILTEHSWVALKDIVSIENK